MVDEAKEDRWEHMSGTPLRPERFGFGVPERVRECPLFVVQAKEDMLEGVGN